MSTREAFEKYADSAGYSIVRHDVLEDDGHITYGYLAQDTFQLWFSWQACQAHNDAVIAEIAKQAEINEALYRDDITELKENLRIAKSSADAEALEVDSRGKLIAELVEALEGDDANLQSISLDCSLLE